MLEKSEEVVGGVFSEQMVKKLSGKVMHNLSCTEGLRTERYGQDRLRGQGLGPRG